MPAEPAAIIFDWDNTLADGWAAIQDGLNAAFRHFGMPEWDRAMVLGNVRKSLAESFPEKFGDQWEKARDIFYLTVQARHLEVLRPMPGAAAALRAAVALAPLAIVSNKHGPLLRAEVEHLRWDGFFRARIGAGDCAADKPDPAPLHAARAACDGPLAADCWYVGDTALDMLAARRAGMRAVLLGDAAHDGGVQACSPDMHFPDALSFAAHLSTLDKRAGLANS